MYDNVGSKLKTLAQISAICGIVGSVICGFISGNFLLGLLIIVVGSLVSWLSSLTLYAFGEMHEYLGAICGHCKNATKVVRDNNKSSANTTSFNAKTSTGNKDSKNYSDQTKITISSGLTAIGSGAFAHRTSLTSVTIPNSVTSIGNDAFYNCKSLEDVYYQGTLEDWCKIKFDNYGSNPCYNGANLYISGELLTNVVVPNSVTSIGKFTFSGCTSLMSVTIPDSVTSIGYGTFYNCTSLTSVTLPDSVTSISSSAFYKCTSLTSVTIGDSVTSIGEDAFRSCTSLTSATVPDSVTSIGNSVFSGCTSLEYNEYDNAYYLGNSSNPYVVLVKAKSTDITSCDINSNTKFIHSSAFYNCTSLTSVTIPESVTSIDDETFHGCTSLSSVTIPDSITSIGQFAFYDCTSLTEIHYNGTKVQWNSISKDSYWNSNTGKYTVYCTDGEIAK